ncbi:MAG: alpha/beta hydrolase family protein [Herbaspirillum sp.]|nr:alpha/beta hydrolase family protein [Herbaspirillum sp.]
MPIRFLIFVWLLLIPAIRESFAQSTTNSPSSNRCGEVVTISTHNDTTTRYAFTSVQGARIALVLLAGGGGHLNLDDKGCPRALRGNSLVRMLPAFRDAGFVTALVDAPSDMPGDDGLAGFRIASQHADDLGKVIADVRSRTGAAIWLVGTSRGTISAVNVATRLSGSSAPDGLVLTSALMSGDTAARKRWIAHTVFNLNLEAIKLPLLVIGHAADNCLRSPPTSMRNIMARVHSVREQVVTVTGGPIEPGMRPSLEACSGSAPHGFVEQETEVAGGIARFINGGRY